MKPTAARLRRLAKQAQAIEDALAAMAATLPEGALDEERPEEHPRDCAEAAHGLAGRLQTAICRLEHLLERRQAPNYHWVHLQDTGSTVALCTACAGDAVSDLKPRRVKDPHGLGAPHECDRCGERG